MRDRLILLFLALVVAGCFGHLVYPSGPFSGRVVDAATGQPLAGAAVVAVWRQEGPGPGHPTERLHDALEVVADADGYFTLPRKTHFTSVGSISDPYIVVYSPGYKEEVLQGRRFREPESNDRPLTVALTRPASSDRRRFADIPSEVGGVPYSKIPNLVRLVNIERRALGLQHYEVK
jgi:hypothetical protein